MDANGSDYRYAMKCVLYNAHAADVRVVKPTSYPVAGILTGSRDSMVKVWTPEGKSFKECYSFSGGTAFISSLCVLPPSTQYPTGLFLAGSNDCSIYGFTPGSSVPVLRLHGHSGAVCSLSYEECGCLVSGSWDKTARVWSGQHCVLTLQGHLEAVWSTDIFPTQNLILTGSADHTIRLWRGGSGSRGVCEKVFTGHTDCVRGLAIMSDMKFLSCSNDNTVRLWLTSGDCLKIFKSHTDYIYSISLLGNGTDFVTCGEDQTIKIWIRGVCVQTIVLAPKSLWSVARLSNEDIAVGTSDGKVYVLEKVPTDFFQKVSQSSDTTSEVSDTDSITVDAPVIPYPPFSEDTTTVSDFGTDVFVSYENQSTVMHVCQYNYVTGMKIMEKPLDFQFIEDTFYKKPVEGEVTGSVVPSKKKDYVFDVDVENTIYKLAFNKGENPWDVATKFVAEHDLPTDHIGQIVDYILKNTVATFSNEFFPAKNYLTYVKVNTEGLRGKLLEFCQKVPKEKSLTLKEVDELMLLACNPDIVSIEQMSSLDKAISWNDEYLFPVLDLLRLGVKCKGLRLKVSSKDFMNHMLHILMHTKKNVNIVLVEKIICNMFGMDETEKVLVYYQEKIFETVKEIFTSGEKSIQKAGAALFLNFAISSYNGFDITIERYCLNVVDILTYLIDADAIYRMLVAVGTVCTRNSLAVSYFRSVNVKEFILKFEDISDDPKINKVIELLCADF